MKYKRWSLKEKLEILEQAKEFGVVETCRKFSVSTGNYYNWRKKFDQKGEAGLKTTYQRKSKELREAEEENRSEERRVGKEWRKQGQREEKKKKVENRRNESMRHTEQRYDGG